MNAPVILIWLDVVTGGLHYWTMDDKDQILCNAVNTQANMRFHPESPEDQREKLDADIVAAHEAGNSADEIADVLGLTSEHIDRAIAAG